jgi:P-type conjugative transfer protein TrbG
MEQRHIGLRSLSRLSLWRCVENDRVRGRTVTLKTSKVLSLIVAIAGLTPVATFAAEATPPALTPQQLIEQVRAQEAAAGANAALSPAPVLAPVPAPGLSATLMSVPRPRPQAPTLEDKSRLEAELAYVNSSLKIHQVTDRNTQHPSDAIAAQGKMLFTFTPGGIYEVEAATFHETALQLEPGETLTGKDLPTAGDTARWTIGVTRSGSPPNETTVLIVKPLEADIETNMTITTNRRLYTVILKSSDHTYMPLVGWLYPQDAARELAEQAVTAKKAQEESEALTVPPDGLNFNCSITGAQVAWRPLRVYDDGSKTYLQMSPEMQSYEAPAIFVMEGKTPLLVNYRVKRSIYIVDRLFDRAQLRVGPKTAVDIGCTHRLASR